MASELRNLDLSAHFRIWQILRQQGYYNELTEQPLVKITQSGAPPNSYGIKAANNFPWVFFDDAVTPTKDNVTVYVSGSQRSRATVSVDHRNGWVTFPSPVSGDVSADLLESSVHVLSSYPEDAWLEMNDLPVIACEVLADNSLPFDIGSSLKFRRRQVEIDILARNKGERLDLHGDIQRFIAKLPLINYTAHQPLGPTGEIDTLYNYSDQFIVPIRVLEPDGSIVKPRRGGSDKEKYRSLILAILENVS
jgi:hypothetical protein